MFNDFKNRLSSIGEEGLHARDCACPTTIHNSVNKELTTYSKIIPEFFSYNNEALKIKSLYKRLRELDYSRNRVIPCIDVCRAGNLYAEYFDGMRSFIHKFIDEACSTEPTNLPLMEKQLNTAIQADKMFIDSLFGGKNNEACNEELTEAVKNLEYLVDFIDVITEIHESIDSIFSRSESLFTKYKGMTDALRLVSNSACYACNRIISTIMDTYNDINNALDDKTETPVDNTFKVF